MSESVQAATPFVEAPAPRSVGRRAARPTTREYVRHFALFLLTIATTTIGGLAILGTSVPNPPLPKLNSLFDYLTFIPELYIKTIASVVVYAFAHPAMLGEGLTFSVALLAILTAHEFGHYFTCRAYGVDATLPFFIPAPPLIGPGTFGAFIKIKSPIPSRRALFDIGVSGPLAGFAVAVPVAIVGLSIARVVPPISGAVVYFNNPLLVRFIAAALKVNLNQLEMNALSFAAWLGFLVTSLNLLPVGQLDGGHALYAVFGPRAHRWLGRAAFATMATLSVLGWFWHHSPAGLLYTVLLGVMLRVGHPQTVLSEPLGGKRTAVAIFTLIVFALSFWPFPISFG